MADRGGLENRCGFRVTVGSNPTLSAVSLSISMTGFCFYPIRRFPRLSRSKGAGSPLRCEPVDFNDRLLFLSDPPLPLPVPLQGRRQPSPL